MTSLDDGDSSGCGSRVAALTAVHIVSQILDEAYIIANAAKESGHPWHYLSMVKNLRGIKTSESFDDEFSCTTYKRDGGEESKIEIIANDIATSTPQKITDDKKNTKNEVNIIGQGDEDFDFTHSYLSQTTSTLISHLFDMSDVERIVDYNEAKILYGNHPECNIRLKEAMNKIIESYVETACDIAASKNPPVDVLDEMGIGLEPRFEEYSDNAFLADIFGSDLSKNVAFYIDDEVVPSTEKKNIFEAEVFDNEQIVEGSMDEIKKDDYSGDVHIDTNGGRMSNIDAYLTLNRDYEQYSDDDGEPVLEVTQGLSMHEVKLMTAPTSEEDLSSKTSGTVEVNQENKLAATSVPTSRKTLAHRCRLHGARLLASLRGWWRRRTPRKQREYRTSTRGCCTLSPDARRRAASLLDHRLASSSLTSRSAMWKFNTVNEVVVNTDRYKDYMFTSEKPGEYGEA